MSQLINDYSHFPQLNNMSYEEILYYYYGKDIDDYGKDSRKI